ncbi:MAG: transketolase [Candidatus Eremiobacteraeota bacterium]|nr:transketolase [Candidatus Eremiobacteraeota bacterium]
MKKKELKKKAVEMRIDLIKMLAHAKSGHSGSPLGTADMFTALYFGGLMKYDPENPQWEERDRFVLSNGHVCPILYVALANAGFFPVEELKTLRQIGTRLQGHPHRLDTPGVEVSAGSLGQGISVAVGMAMGLKSDGNPNNVICMMGDGELEEGSCWEAFMIASRYKLDNLTVIIDRNFLQIDGRTEDVSCLERLGGKLKAFGLEVFRCDGNNIGDFIETFNKAGDVKGKTSVIIARTIMGKGVSFMEDNHEWHGKPPNKEQAEIALGELNMVLAKYK